MTKAMALLLESYRDDCAAGCEMRLGQWFCVMYLGHKKVLTWANTNLYDETKNTISRQTIAEWMETHSYSNCLPQRLH